MLELNGRCHCGNISVRFTSEQDASELQVRACQCGFCRRHGVRTVTDSGGTVEIEVSDGALLNRYRFGLSAADFLVCARCGVYVGAVLEQDGRCVSTTNLNTFGPTPFDGRDPAPANYSEESRDGRTARRLSHWTPTTLTVSG